MLENGRWRYRGERSAQFVIAGISVAPTVRSSGGIWRASLAFFFRRTMRPSQCEAPADLM